LRKLGSFSSWAREKPLFWCNLLLILITVWVFFFPGPVLENGPSDLRIRVWGVTLQLVGVWTVWRNLTGTAKLFGLQHPIDDLRNWFKQLFRPTVVSGTSGSASGSVSASGRMKARFPVNVSDPIPDRISNLEKNFELIDRDLDSAFSELQSEASKLRGQIASEAVNREVADSGLREQLKGATVGNFGVLAFGIVWLAVGIVLASFAMEFARLRTGDVGAVWRAL
jgi:hypothetical protein